MQSDKQEWEKNIKLCFQMYRDITVFHGVSAISCHISVRLWALCWINLFALPLGLPFK